MDAFYQEACKISELDPALTILAIVVSRPTSDRAVVDVGRKAINIEVHKPRVAGKRGVHVDRLSAEHGILTIDPDGDQLSIGEQIELVPGYADLTTVLHRRLHAFRDGRLEKTFRLGCD